MREFWTTDLKDTARQLRQVLLAAAGAADAIDVLSALRVSGLGEEFMKNTKRCPKCQSSDVILVPGKREPGGAGNLISVSRWNLFNTVAPVLHVCGSCGYMENWIDSTEDIAKVKARYARE